MPWNITVRNGGQIAILSAFLIDRVQLLLVVPVHELTVVSAHHEVDVANNKNGPKRTAKNDKTQDHVLGALGWFWATPRTSRFVTDWSNSGLANRRFSLPILRSKERASLPS